MPRVAPSQVTKFIDRVFGGTVPQFLDHTYSDKLSALIDLIDRIPEELYTLDSNDYNNLIISVAAIRNSLEVWRSQGNVGTLGPMMPKISNWNPVNEIRQALVKCPDEFPPTETNELNFISDVELRKSLRGDLATIQKALSNGEYKAATVIAGSILEALLLWKLQKTKRQSSKASATARELELPKASKPLEEWDLHHYVEVAYKMALIKEQTVNSISLAKDFRNLIHPGRAQRLGQVCDIGTAHTAIGAVFNLIRDLTP